MFGEDRGDSPFSYPQEKLSNERTYNSLKRISFNDGPLRALEVCFGNASETKRFGKKGDDLLRNHFSLETAQEIRTIKAKIDPSSNIDALWFLDSSQRTILKKDSGSVADD